MLILGVDLGLCLWNFPLSIIRCIRGCFYHIQSPTQKMHHSVGEKRKKIGKRWQNNCFLKRRFSSELRSGTWCVWSNATQKALKQCCDSKKKKNFTWVPLWSINQPIPTLSQGLNIFKNKTQLYLTTFFLQIFTSFYCLSASRLLNYPENHPIFSPVSTINPPLTSGKTTVKRSFLLEKRGRRVQILSLNGKKAFNFDRRQVTSGYCAAEESPQRQFHICLSY